MTQRTRKKRPTKRPPRRRRSSASPASPEGSQAEDAGPEIKTGYGPAGRETLAAIAEEVGLAGFVPKRRRDAEPGPEIEISQGSAGRETLAAISHELLGSMLGDDPGDSEPESRRVRARAPTQSSPTVPRPSSGPTVTVRGAGADRARSGAAPREGVVSSVPPPRPRLRTLGFSDPPPGAAPSRSPSRAAAVSPPPPRSSRKTLDAIEKQLADWAETGQPPPAAQNQSAVEFEVFEMATFVVRGDLSHLASTTARRKFVRDRLLHRLPVKSVADVDRIDVTPWTVRGTVVVRVWCRVPPP